MDSLASADPFLAFHYQGARKFDLSGLHNPASIRDQLVRAQMLAVRIEGTVFDPRKHDGSRIAVIGSGPAAVEFAVTAANLQMPVELVFDGRSTFARFKDCSTRRIDLTAYDWPADHAINTDLLWGNGSNYLEPYLYWEGTKSASEVVKQWNLKLDSQKDSSILKISRNSVFCFTAPDPRVSGPIPYHLGGHESKHTARNNMASAVILATGPGSENVKISDGHSCRGVEFWANDGLGSDNFGLGDNSGATHILISGGGDGAIQDFIRAVVKPSRLEHSRICDLMAELGECSADAARWLRAPIEHAERQLVWGNKQHDCAVLCLLEKEFVKRVDVAFADATVQEYLDSILREELTKTKALTVEFSHACSHFGICYPINRFLALLIIKYLSDVCNVSTRSPRTRLAELAPGEGHVGSAKGPCRGSHSYRLKPKLCSDEFGCDDETTNPLPNSRRADLIVIRHGIEKSGSITATKRQILPYSALKGRNHV